MREERSYEINYERSSFLFDIEATAGRADWRNLRTATEFEPFDIY